MFQQKQNSIILWCLTFTLVVLSALVLSACADTGGTAELAPSEEEQIKAMVEDYFRRDPSIPEYVADIEAVTNHWARVSLSPVGVETDEKMIVYVQDQENSPDPVPTAALTIAQPRNNADTETKLGWAIITQPQVHFTDEELDAAQVPEEIRP